MADETQPAPGTFAPLYAALQSLFGAWISGPLASLKAGSRKSQMAFAITFAAVMSAGSLWHYGLISWPRDASRPPPAYATAASVNDLAAETKRMADAAASKGDVAELTANLNALKTRIDRIESAFMGRRPMTTGSIKRRN